MTLRAALDVKEEYDVARAAYLKALNSESHSISSGQGSRSMSNQSIDSLKAQMDSLSNEYSRLSGSGKIQVRGMTPVSNR